MIRNGESESWFKSNPWPSNWEVGCLSASSFNRTGPIIVIVSPGRPRPFAIVIVDPGAGTHLRKRPIVVISIQQVCAIIGQAEVPSS